MTQKQPKPAPVRTSSRKGKGEMPDTSVMSRMSVFTRKDKTTEYGLPGSFSGVAHRAFLVRWRRLSVQGRLGLTLLLTAAGGVLGYAGSSSLNGALIGAGIALGLWLLTIALFATPGVISVTFVILGTVVALPFLGMVYTGSVAGTADPVGGALALFFAYAVAVFIGLRWGRGRGWVTAMSLTMSMIILGPSMLLLFPELGLNAARISLLLVLLARCGGFAWISGTSGIIWDRFRNGKDEEGVLDVSVADPQNVSLAWERQAIAERNTGRILRTLGPDYTVYHDVIVPKTKHHIGQVVVGPTGMKMIVSAQALGTVYVDPQAGLIVPQVDVEQLSWLLIGQRMPLARALRVNPKDIELILAIHGSYALDRMTVAAVDLDGTSRAAAVNITVVGSETLASTVSDGFKSWSTMQIARVNRRARMRIVSSIMPQSVAVNIPSSTEFSVMDADGNVVQRIRTEATNNVLPAVSAPHVWRPGDKVQVETNKGLLSNLRIVSDVTLDERGEPVVKVCTEEDWQDNNGNVEMPETLLRCFTFPVSSVLHNYR